MEVVQMSNNSIKFILEKKGKKQKDLEYPGCSKQSVSKYVLRQRKIDEYTVQHWEAFLKIPHQFFVDEKGYCKELNLEEEQKLHDFLLKQDFEKYDMQKEILARKAMEDAERHSYINYQTKIILNGIKTDIATNHSMTDVYTMEDVLDFQEANLKFYEMFLKLRKSSKISEHEWESLFKAMSIFLLAEPTADWLPSGSLAQKLYEAMHQDRIRVEEQRKDSISWYTETFGEPKPEGL